LSEDDAQSLDARRQVYFKRNKDEFILPKGAVQKTVKETGTKDLRVGSNKIKNLDGVKLSDTLLKNVYPEWSKAVKGGNDRMRLFLKSLTEGQRTLLLVSIVKPSKEVFSGAPPILLEITEALKAVGADEHLALIRKAGRYGKRLPELEEEAKRQYEIYKSAKAGNDEAKEDKEGALWFKLQSKLENQEDKLEDQLEEIFDELEDLSNDKIFSRIRHYVEPRLEDFVV